MPTTDEVLASFSARARISLDEVKQHPHGLLFDSVPPVFAAPPSETATGRFALMPADVADELQRAYQSVVAVAENPRPFHLAVRRAKETMNTFGKQLPGLAPVTQNPCHMHPTDVAQLALEGGALVTVTSDHGTISTTISVDASMKQGVVSITHGFGTLPASTSADGSSDSPVGLFGTNVNQLLSMHTDLQSISAMPQMTGVPVTIERV